VKWRSGRRDRWARAVKARELSGQKTGRFVTLEDHRVIFIDGPEQGSGSYPQKPEWAIDDPDVPFWSRDTWNRSEWIRTLCGAGTRYALEPEEMEQVELWLERVPSEHLAQLNGIYVYHQGRSSTEYAGQTVDSEGYLVYRNQGGVGRAIGLYSPYLHPRTGEFIRGTIEISGDQDFDKHTLIHELGHHVARLRPDALDQVTQVYGQVMQGAYDSLSNSDAEFRFDMRLRSVGLRNYSLSNAGEFFADLYTAVYTGETDNRMDKAQQFWEDFGGEQHYSEVFK
jgi:hypothetical protein